MPCTSYTRRQIPQCSFHESKEETQSRQLQWLALGHLRKKQGWRGAQSCLILSLCFFCGSVFGLLNAVSTHEFINSVELLTQVWLLSPRSFLPHYSIKGKCTTLVIIIITRQQPAEGWGWVFPIFMYHLRPLSTMYHTWQTRYKYFMACAYALLTYFFNRAYWSTTKKSTSNYYQDDIISQSVPKVVLL